MAEENIRIKEDYISKIRNKKPNIDFIKGQNEYFEILIIIYSILNNIDIKNLYLNLNEILTKIINELDGATLEIFNRLKFLSFIKELNEETGIIINYDDFIDIYNKSDKIKFQLYNTTQEYVIIDSTLLNITSDVFTSDELFDVKFRSAEEITNMNRIVRDFLSRSYRRSDNISTRLIGVIFRIRNGKMEYLTGNGSVYKYDERDNLTEICSKVKLNLYANYLILKLKLTSGNFKSKISIIIEEMNDFNTWYNILDSILIEFNKRYYYRIIEIFKKNTRDIPEFNIVQYNYYFTILKDNIIRLFRTVNSNFETDINYFVKCQIASLYYEWYEKNKHTISIRRTKSVKPVVSSGKNIFGVLRDDDESDDENKYYKLYIKYKTKYLKLKKLKNNI
jgi:hypothetical protein